jgi:hypothetical protein
MDPPWKLAHFGSSLPPRTLVRRLARSDVMTSGSRRRKSARNRQRSSTITARTLASIRELDTIISQAVKIHGKLQMKYVI